MDSISTFCPRINHEAGAVYGPYHHYCKAIKPEFLQCFTFLSTDPMAELVKIEYLVDNKVARSNVCLKRWNRYYHDHKKEIATGVWILNGDVMFPTALSPNPGKT